MATSSPDTRRPLGEAPAEPAGSSHGAARHAPFAPTLALTVTLAVAGFTVLMSAVVLAIHPDLSILSNRFGDQQNQTAKTALYVVVYAVILPVALIAVPRLADAILAGPSGAALPALAGALAATLEATFIAVKVSSRLPWGDGLGVVLVAGILWCAVAAAALARAARPRAWPPLLRLSGLTEIIWVATALLAFGVLLCVSSVRSLNGPVLALGVIVAAAVLVVHERRRLPRLSRRWGTGVDVVLTGLLLLAVPDVVIFTTSSAPVNAFLEPGIIQYHHDWLLGPTNQLLAGGALMVNDPISQYGVGTIYFLAAWFHIAPIGYGTYGFLDGVLTALFYASAYWLLRIVGTSRLLAAATLSVAVVVLVYNLPYSVGALPQEGPLRFGLPMGVTVATVIGARWPRHARAMRAVALVLLGVSSIWALEAFGYTVFTFAAMATLQAWMLPAGRRLRRLGREAAFAAGACVCAQLTFAGVTLAGTGELPRWGQYLAYVRSFVFGGKAAEFVYGFPHWPPGLVVGAGYLASAAAIVLIARRRSGVVERRPPLLIALTGTTAYGIALFSYADNRSATHFLPYVTLPALLAGALWLSLVLRAPGDASRRLRLGSLALTLAVAVLLLAAAWPEVSARFPRTALAHAYPGGGLRAAVHRLWHPPPIDPRSPEGERLLARFMPGQRRVLILLPASPDLATDILIRSGRANTLPLGDPKADGYVASSRLPDLRRAIAKLRPGDRLLMDRQAQLVIAALRAHRAIDPLTQPVFGYYPIEEWILRRIDARFRLRPIHAGKDGFVVAELARRPAG
jgi:hypothetical protein